MRRVCASASELLGHLAQCSGDGALAARICPSVSGESVPDVGMRDRSGRRQSGEIREAGRVVHKTS